MLLENHTLKIFMNANISGSISEKQIMIGI